MTENTYQDFEKYRSSIVANEFLQTGDQKGAQSSLENLLVGFGTDKAEAKRLVNDGNMNLQQTIKSYNEAYQNSIGPQKIEELAGRYKSILESKLGDVYSEFQKDVEDNKDMTYTELQNQIREFAYISDGIKKGIVKEDSDEAKKSQKIFEKYGNLMNSLSLAEQYEINKVKAKIEGNSLDSEFNQIAEAYKQRLKESAEKNKK